MTRRLALAACALACACAPAGTSTRSLHYIDKDLVSTPSVDQRAYAAYLQASLALEATPPDLPRALEQIELALWYDRDDPHLWATRGAIELRLGHVDAARRSSARALALGPAYPPARQLAASLPPSGDAPQVAARRRRR